MKKESNGRVITPRDLNKMAFRSLLNQAAFNYERMQNIGFTAAMAPELQKIYKDDKETLAEVTEDNLEFINTHNVLLPFLIGLMLSLYEKKEKPETVRNIKVALFGPMAGIGDAIFWFTLLPIMAGICSSLASDGNVLGPILYFLVFLTAFILRFPLAHLGYNAGTKVFGVIQKGAQKINQAATVLGITILGGLIGSYVYIEVLTEVNTGSNIISLQADFFDKIIPNFLPFVFTFGIYGLLKKKVNPTILILGTLLLSIVLSFFGIL